MDKNLEEYIKATPKAKGAKNIKLDYNITVKENDQLNVIYEVEKGLFVHAYNDDQGNRFYASIGPKMDKKEQKKFEEIK